MAILPLFSISLLFHAWVGWRVAPELAAIPGLDWAGSAFWLLMAMLAALMPLGFVARRRNFGRMAVALTWAGLLALGLFSSLFVLTVLRDAFLVSAWLPAALWPELMDLDALQQYSAAAVPVLGLLASVWGFWNARRTARVIRVDVPIANLPLALHGFTVAQISDVHVGPTIKGGYLQRIVDRVNTLGVDMVAITGDLVDGRVPELASHVAPLSALVSRHGTFFVTGNHEYYSGAHAWITELRRLGVQVLLNQHVVLQHGAAAQAGQADAQLLVAGVADFSAHHFDEAHRSDPQAALLGAPAAVQTRLLLAHQPRSAEAAQRAGFDLQLSGHTHGGQFWPWNHFVRFQQPFTAGLSRLQQLWVYTNRGTGYWGPPKRFCVPSEITHLRLVPA